MIEGIVEGKDIVQVWTSDGRNNNSVWCETSDGQYYKIKASELLKSLQKVDTLVATQSRVHKYLTINEEAK